MPLLSRFAALLAHLGWDIRTDTALSSARTRKSSVPPRWESRLCWAPFLPGITRPELLCLCEHVGRDQRRGRTARRSASPVAFRDGRARLLHGGCANLFRRGVRSSGVENTAIFSPCPWSGGIRLSSPVQLRATIPAAKVQEKSSGEHRGSRVGSSMVEQRPFKALVEGSSPSQPTPAFPL